MTNPQPLEHLVFGFLITAQSVSVSHCSEWLLRLSSFVSKLSPLMKSFRRLSGLFDRLQLRLDCSGGDFSDAYVASSTGTKKLTSFLN